MKWKKVPFAQKYEVSADGQVCNANTGRVLKAGMTGTGYKEGRGYLSVNLYYDGASRTHSVHSLVLRTFVGEPDIGQTGNHFDGNKKHNAIANLEWVSMRENIRHSYRTGLTKRKLSYETALEIRERALADILTPAEIAHFYGVSRSTIGLIKNGEIYAPWHKH